MTHMKNISFYQRLKELYLFAVKPLHTEEFLAIIFFRPLGFVVAMLAKKLHISPNILSIIRGITGIWGGVLFFMATPESIFMGAIILIFSQILDYADGSLARILGKSTQLGVILDGVGDWIALTAVYIGTTFVLFKRNPESGPFWWIIVLVAFVCLFFHIYTQGFLRFEFFLFTAKDTSKHASKGHKDARKTIDDLKEKFRTEKNLFKKLSTGIMIAFNAGLNLTSGLVLLKSYKGYFDFYQNMNNLPEEKQEIFRKNYKKNNGWILLVFNNIGLLSNLMIFIITALFNRLDLAFFIMLIGSNIYFIICIIIQRICFMIQLTEIKQ